MDHDKEMQKALEADGEKLRALTGEDHGPFETTTELPILSGMADGQDPSIALNMRDWLRKACEAQGAKFTGGGIGLGGADIDIELEGVGYNVFIKPIIR